MEGILRIALRATTRSWSRAEAPDGLRVARDGARAARGMSACKVTTGEPRSRSFQDRGGDVDRGLRSLMSEIERRERLGNGAVAALGPIGWWNQDARCSFNRGMSSTKLQGRCR